MKKYSFLKFLILTLLFIVQLFNKVKAGDADSSGIKFRSITFEQAVAAAKAENKNVFIHWWEDGCHYCEYMKDSVYPDKEVGNFFNANFVSIKINEKDGKEMNRSLRIHTYPAMLFYDSNGEIMHRAAGRKYKKPLMELGREALDPRKQMRTYKNKYDSAYATPEEVQFYFRMQEMAGMDAQMMLDDYLRKQPDADFTNANNWRIIYDILKYPTLKVMSRILENKKEFEKKYTADSINNKIINLYNRYLMDFVQRVDSAGYERTKLQILGTKNLDIAEKICAFADINKLKMKSEWAAYKIEGKKFVEKYAMDDFRRLLEVSQVYYDRMSSDKVALAEAEKWMLRSVSMGDYYKGNNLLASIYVMLGNKEQALKYANHAIDLAKKSNTDYKQTTLLLDRIETMQ